MDYKEVAERAGIHPGHFSRMINGKTGTTPETVTAIANVLNLDLPEALNKAGFGHPKSQTPQNPIAEQLLRHFHGLPRERQKDLVLLAEALWRKHGPHAKETVDEPPDDLTKAMEK